MDPVEQNIRGVQQLVGSKLNKSIDGASGQPEGVQGEFRDEFTLDLKDEELLHLADQWTKKYDSYEAKIKIRQEANKAYYLGRQKEGTPLATTEGQPISANLLFEAVETFLPAALSKNPEPVVWLDNTSEGNKISNDVKTMLQYHADTLVLRSKLNLVTRGWLINLIGVMKHGWDEEIKEITSDVRDPQNFIFDPEGYVDCYGDFVGYLGERIKVTAEKLISMFPEHKTYITVMANGKLGTDVTYTEWWNDDYCFYTFKETVLDKNKNPHFNYPKVSIETDLDGLPQQMVSEGRNHFAKPKKPYTFLSVFSLEKQPHDETGLIEQNIPNQRRVSRRTEQIDYNLSRQNNSTVFSENNFTQETAKQAATGMAKGHPVLIPAGGPIGEAVVKIPTEGVAPAFFNELENSKNDLRSIFGTQGMTATQPDDQDTARGEILNTQRDSSRIGGGIGDKLEQFADNVFNWWTQLYYVYYDAPHAAAIMGQMKAVEYITLSSENLPRKLVVSVSPDSMKSHDETTEMNQALTLWEKGALDPKTLLTVLNFPDPQNTAAQVMLFKTNPALYMQLNFPELQQMIASTVPQGVAPSPTGGPSPEVSNSPPGSLAAVPPNPSLSSVPINSQVTPVI